MKNKINYLELFVILIISVISVLIINQILR
jgi:hypothetical protein